MKLRLDPFLTGMAAAILLAALFPAPGASGGWLHPELLTKGGVALVFFLNGAGLSFKALKDGVLRWRLHVAIQSATFLLFPLIGLAALAAFGRFIGPDLRLGFFYLCALPSTVSSSVAMTAAARGNVPVAVFNATLSSLIGIFAKTGPHILGLHIVAFFGFVLSAILGVWLLWGVVRSGRL